MAEAVQPGSWNSGNSVPRVHGQAVPHAHEAGMLQVHEPAEKVRGGGVGGRAPKQEHTAGGYRRST